MCTGAEGRGTGQEGVVTGISAEHVLELRETDRMVSTE